MTLIELLESLEAAVAARNSGSDIPAASLSLIGHVGVSTGTVNASPIETEAVLSPGILARQMERAGLNNEEFSSIFGVPPRVLQDWLEAKSAVPSWVLPAIQMLYLLSPAVRQRLLVGALPQDTKKQEIQRKQIKSHPFSRIEDL